MDPNELFDMAARIAKPGVVANGHTEMMACRRAGQVLAVGCPDEQAGIEQAGIEQAGNGQRVNTARTSQLDQRQCEDALPLREPVHRYRDRSAYRAAIGRNFPRDQVIDTRDFRSEMAVVDLRRQQPTVAEFIRLIRRDLKLRNYKKRTMKAYLQAIASLLRWSGRMPHEVDRETVKEYLLYLVDSENGYSEVSVHSSAIRTVFDKFCFLDVTLGIETPKRDKKQPVVLSQDEVRRLLEAAVTLRDKLLLGLMYATRYLASRTVQRVMKRAVQVAKITKQATPHSLRHSFATHSFEDGCDIRRIQKVLGHVRLETTTIYVHLAKPTDPTKMPSPLDRLNGAGAAGGATHAATSDSGSNRKGGWLPNGFAVAPRIHVKQVAGEKSVRVTIEILANGKRVFLTGVRTIQSRADFWTLAIPPLEDWRAEIGRLNSRQRQGIQEAEFYEFLRDAIGRRLRAIAARASGLPGAGGAAQAAARVRQRFTDGSIWQVDRCG